MSKDQEEMFELGYEQGVQEAYEMILKAFHSRWAKLPNGHYRTAMEWAKWLQANKEDIMKGKMK